MWFGFSMVAVVLVGLAGAVAVRRRPTLARTVGAVAWIATSAYVVAEVIVARATTSSYDAARQPMSDLGVTTCGSDTYPLAPYELCSPLYGVMNATFVLTGLAIAVGALALEPRWPRARGVRTATVLLVVFGLSFAVSGALPADVAFEAHVLVSLPGMVVQIPALVLLGRVLRPTHPRLARWSLVAAIASVLVLVGLGLQPVVDLPGGLLQRALYLVVFAWATGTGLTLLLTDRRPDTDRLNGRRADRSPRRGCPGGAGSRR